MMTGWACTVPGFGLELAGLVQPGSRITCFFIISAQGMPLVAHIIHGLKPLGASYTEVWLVN